MNKIYIISLYLGVTYVLKVINKQCLGEVFILDFLYRVLPLQCSVLVSPLSYIVLITVITYLPV